MTYAIPDVNLTTMSETLDQAVRLDRATDLPVVVDCDNGFGGLNNVVRTLVEFESAGLAAIFGRPADRRFLFAGPAARVLLQPGDPVQTPSPQLPQVQDRPPA
jgi:hypothetical protein